MQRRVARQGFAGPNQASDVHRRRPGPGALAADAKPAESRHRNDACKPERCLSSTRRARQGVPRGAARAKAEARGASSNDEAQPADERAEKTGATVVGDDLAVRPELSGIAKASLAAEVPPPSPPFAQRLASYESLPASSVGVEEHSRRKTSSASNDSSPLVPATQPIASRADSGSTPGRAGGLGQPAFQCLSRTNGAGSSWPTLQLLASAGNSSPGPGLALPPSDGFSRAGPAADQRLHSQCGAEDGPPDVLRARPKNSRGESSFVRVVARVRPRLPHELCKKQGVNVLEDGHTIEVFDATQHRKKNFTVDEVIDSRCEESMPQSAFFAKVGQELVQRSLQGYNVCVFAYGRTGSGKTHTMLGGGRSLIPGVRGEGAGFMPRFLQALHKELMGVGPQQETKYHCEFFEIYNERIRDLLAPPQEKSSHRTRAVHVHPKYGVVIEGLTPSVCTEVSQAMDLIHFGNQMRTVSATTMNQRSSRSHAVFRFRYELSRDEREECRSPSGQGVQSTVMFLDLAGREDQSAGAGHSSSAQFREMVSINTSLFHLSSMIQRLSEGTANKDRDSLKDFRNSKLTLLLSQALAGNSTTAVIVTIPPLAEYFDDIASTLAFAQTAKKVRTQPAVNKRRRDMVAELEAEVRRLRQELSEARNHSDTSAAYLAEQNRQIADVQSLVDHYGRPDYDGTKDWEMLQHSREEVMLQYGLTRSSCGESPFLTNMSSDPMLRGIINFSLREDRVRIGSDASACGIVIVGVGVSPVMCEIRRLPGNTFTIQVIADSEDFPRVLVNGCTLDVCTPRQLTNKDCLIFGYARVFRFIIPRPADDPRDPDEDVDLDSRSAIIQMADTHSKQFLSAAAFLRHFSERAPPHVVDNFLKALHRVCPLLDEANVITRKIRLDGNALRFELHALADVCDFENDKPELVICLIWEPRAMDRFRSGVHTIMAQRKIKMKSAVRDPGNAEGGDECATDGYADSVDADVLPVVKVPTGIGAKPLMGHARIPFAHSLGLGDHMTLGGEKRAQLMYVWSIEKFLGRLCRMRELYEEGEDENSLESIRRNLIERPYLDPWHEVSLNRIQLLAEGVSRADDEDMSLDGSPDAGLGVAAGFLGAGGHSDAKPRAGFHAPVRSAVARQRSLSKESEARPPKEQRSRGQIQVETASRDDVSSAVPEAAPEAAPESAPERSPVQGAFRSIRSASKLVETASRDDVSSTIPEAAPEAAPESAPERSPVQGAFRSIRSAAIEAPPTSSMSNSPALSSANAACLPSGGSRCQTPIGGTVQYPSSQFASMSQSASAFLTPTSPIPTMLRRRQTSPTPRLQQASAPTASPRPTRAELQRIVSLKAFATRAFATQDVRHASPSELKTSQASRVSTASTVSVSPRRVMAPPHMSSTGVQLIRTPSSPSIPARSGSFSPGLNSVGLRDGGMTVMVHEPSSARAFSMATVYLYTPPFHLDGVIDYQAVQSAGAAEVAEVFLPPFGWGVLRSAQGLLLWLGPVQLHDSSARSLRLDFEASTGARCSFCVELYGYVDKHAPLVDEGLLHVLPGYCVRVRLPHHFGAAIKSFLRRRPVEVRRTADFRFRNPLINPPHVWGAVGAMRT